MTTLDRFSEPVSAASRSALPARLVNTVAALYRAWKNRREVYRLGELSDFELADIGLTRSDLHIAISSPFGTDPTALLRSRAQARTLGLEDAARRIN
jgi:uncharacterized protein YjiS (DUF1127 family)